MPLRSLLLATALCPLMLAPALMLAAKGTEEMVRPTTWVGVTSPQYSQRLLRPHPPTGPEGSSVRCRGWR